ncbi:hypothetical protein TNCV_1298721 [Trichonephila clavipes]|nr:hypothetical protein TNCV_1298721 [Trichonephila clavipes]
MFCKDSKICGTVYVLSALCKLTLKLTATLLETDCNIETFVDSGATNNKIGYMYDMASQTNPKQDSNRHMGIWRHRNENMCHSCILYRKLSPTSSLMVWVDIGYTKRIPIVHPCSQ